MNVNMLTSVANLQQSALPPLSNIYVDSSVHERTVEKQEDDHYESEKNEKIRSDRPKKQPQFFSPVLEKKKLTEQRSCLCSNCGCTQSCKWLKARNGSWVLCNACYSRAEGNSKSISRFSPYSTK
jgi:hypothetical protein